MKRLLVVLLSAIMILSLVPVSVFALPVQFSPIDVESVSEDVNSYVSAQLFGEETPGDETGNDTGNQTQEITVKVGVYDYTASDLKLEGASENGVVLDKVSVSVPVGTSALDAVKKALEENSIYAEFDGSYLKKANELGEGTGYSGWCLSYNNDDFSNWGLEYITLSDGDVFEYHYSCNFDTTTDDIGNGWYGLPIITELEIGSVKKTFSKKTAYDESFNAVTTYYEGASVISGKGTQEEPFEINVVVPYGTDVTKLKATYKTSLNEHYRTVSKDIVQENDYTEPLEFTLSTRGGKYVAYYSLGVSVKSSGGSVGGNPDYDDDDEEDEQQNKAELDEKKVSGMLSDTVDYIISIVPNPDVSSTGGEWTVAGLAKAGKLSPGMKTKYINNLKNKLKKNNGILGEKYSEYARVCIALLATEYDDVDMFFDLAHKLYDTQTVIDQGSTSSAFAYIVLSHIENDEKAEKAMEEYLSHMLSCQNKDGGFSLVKGGLSDVDVTSMILCALSPVRNKKNVKTSVNDALEFISKVQTDNGGFKNSGIETSESASQVIIALSSLGISLTDERFVKNGNTVFDALCEFEDGGSFSHAAGEKASVMATEQALCALAALELYIDGDECFYEFSAIEKPEDNNYVGSVSDKDENKDDGNDEAKESEKGTAEDNKQTETPINQVQFTDVTRDAYGEVYEKVYVLCSKGIVNGMGNGLFSPEKSMTRAQLTAVLVRSIGETAIEKLEEKAHFTDVAEDAWYASVVNTAYAYGIVNGMSESEFAPENTVTLEQCAVIIVRTLSKLGVDTSLTSDAVRNSLSQFSDYKNVSDYAQSALAFCYINGILSEDELTIEPKSAVIRIDMVEMVYNALMLVNE